MNQLARIVVVLISILFIDNVLHSQDPPNLMTEGYIHSKGVPTEAGTVTFIGYTLAFEGSNYVKIFKESAFGNTLYSNQRREKCYRNSLMVASQIPIVVNEEDPERINKVVRGMVKYAKRTSSAVNYIDSRNTNYIKADAGDLAAITWNYTSKLLRKINPKSKGGIKIETTNLHHLANGLKALQGIAICADFAYNAALREALVSGEALARLTLIEDAFKKREQAGNWVDPSIYVAIQEARAMMTASDEYYGALLMEMTERRDELIDLGISAGLSYVKKHYATEAIAKYYAHHSMSHATSTAIAGKSATVAGLWGISLMLTYQTIKGLVEQHEKVQTGITSTTLAWQLNQEILAGRLENSETVEGMIMHLEYLYYDQMVEASEGFLPDFRDFIDNIIFGEKYNLAWNEYFADLEKRSRLALGAVDLFDYPEISPDNTSQASIGFIIDSSSSMKDSDPDNIRITALYQIIKQLRGDENVFIIDFDGGAEWKTKDMWNSWSTEMLEEQVGTIDSNGSTDIGLGLETLRDALNSSMIDYSKTAVLLLSDGEGTYDDQIQWYTKNGVPVYTISYKDNADANLLSSLASASGGLYIQADSEHDVIAAFMQFFDDLRGSSKFFSYKGNFQGSAQQTLPSFYVDGGTSYMSCNMTWSGGAKSFILTSPDGITYSKNSQNSINVSLASPVNKHRSIETLDYFQQASGRMDSLSEKVTWSSGNNFDLIQIIYPRPGKWSVKVATTDQGPSNDDFIFESSGETPEKVYLENEFTGSAFSFKFRDESGSIDWSRSEARIILSTPDLKARDLSENYQDGTFQVYPREGEGNYSIDLRLKTVNSKGDSIQRHFNRSVFLGEVVPGYLGVVDEVLGGYIRTSQGRFTGNSPGIECKIFSANGDRGLPIAVGYVQDVNDKECTIRITEIFSDRNIQIGDMVELDIIQWQNDIN